MNGIKQNNRKGVFVLLHGAWHGGWCWKRVMETLAASGHRVLTPTLPGLGARANLMSQDITLDTFIQDLVDLIEGEDLHDVILVGHSFGGIGITGAAERIPSRIRHLVYLDAMILEDGDSAFSILPPNIAAERRQQAAQFSNSLSMPVPDASAFGITDPADKAWVEANCTPHPVSTYEDTCRLNGLIGNGLPSTYVAVKPDYEPLAASRAIAKKQLGWSYLEIDAGHDAMITSPQAVVELLLDIHRGM
ncbi:alpha/beta fold hydrolase [Vreelandella maris]|uniref:alpha/beta fold hydrolase n=1 Tax=Vreelandella maris TaxID=2729617 RepID=UPI001C3D94B2|nr:alpha/beta fold hydrolase [Halomonas maris]